MQGNLPIKFKELQKLTNLNIKQELCRFQTLSLESDKFISVKDQGEDGSPVMIIINIENGFDVTRRPMKAEAFIMHPDKNIIALRAKNESGNGHFIQVFDMDSREKLVNCDMGENIVFWRWLDDKTIAAVGATGCYHVIMGENTPKKVFSRDGQLSTANNGQIIGYTADDSKQWLLLTAINTPDQGRTINGNMQLYFTEANRQQFLEGHAGCFGQSVVHDDDDRSSVFCFAERKGGETTSKFHVMEIGKPKEGQTKFKKSCDISYSPDYPNDFPVLMQMAEKYGIVFMITKCGFLFLFEVASCNCIFRNRISDDTIFVSTRNRATDGLIGINRKGQVLSINVDSETLVSFISNSCRHIPDAVGVAAKLASRYGLGGADDLFVSQFNKMLATGDYKGAARVAGDAPGGILRNEDTINKFKQLTGTPPPIMQYFSVLLEKGKLNAIESIELAKPVLQQGRANMIENWLKEGKLECTEELGTLCKQFDNNLGLSIYLRSNSPARVIEGFLETKQFEKVMPYCQKVNYSPDWTEVLQRVVITNPEGALRLAQMLTTREGGQRAQVDLEVVVDIFMSHNKLLETTEFLIKALEGNRSEEGHLQTRLLELNLMAAPAVAKTILEMNMLSHFDKPKIAQLCERQGLFSHALNNYTDIADIKRVVVNTHPPNGLSPEQINEFLGNLTPQNALECLYELMKSNRQNLQIVVQGAINYHQQIKIPPLIQMFESFGSFDGLFYFLGSVINTVEDEDISFKYIEAATKLNQVKEVERIIKETSCYDAVKVKNYLKEAKLPDPRPLIFLCDKHGYISELTQYLYKNNLNKFIEVYLFRVNPNASPEVIGALIDLECDEVYIKQLLNNIRANCPVEQLVQEVEERNKLRILQSWLEARSTEGMQTPELHNALAKIYIDINKDPQSFLINNQFYDSKVVGKYCEDRDPHLAYTAYKRAWGSCDNELVDVTNKNNLYRLQARYLVERQCLDLWGTVLNEENPHRRSVIDQVVATALPETKNPEEVSTTVKAFMTADLPNELMELLEKIVLHNSDFSNNKNLQNLLILTAIKADTSRVMDYINRLDNYDGPELAKIALGSDYQLYEEAFVIYKKSDNFVEAIEVLLNNIENLERAQEFAEKVNLNEVWSKLAQAQLDSNCVTQAIESFLKAKDTSAYHQVIQVAEREEKFEDLAVFLKVAREQNKDQVIDNELLYSYARCNKLEDVETFISMSNSADTASVGDRCYNEKLFEAAKLLFQNVGNNAKLASCLVNLGQFQTALEAAKKANTPKTWKEINFACVKAKEFRLAAIAGSNIIIHPDHLEELILHYEKYGYYDELISLLESGLGLERAHIGMFTELGILYAKYRPERLMDHCRSYYGKLNIPKLYRACDRYRMWPEAVFLYMHYDEHDSAIITMMEHSPSAWQHELFVQNILKVANQDLYYRAISFYLDEEPMLLNDLLKVLSQKIDHAKVVQVVKRTGYIALILDFLKSVQHHNNNTVNDAINEIMVENEDWESLRTSIENYDNFDQITMAQRLERHNLLELRRIAAVLYRLNKRYEQSIELSKKEEMFKDAMETAAESGDSAIAEKLLRFFVQQEKKECFSACCFTCYELLKPDLVMELAWRFGYMEFAMPFFIQSMSHMNKRIGQMEKKFMRKDKQEEDEKERKANEPIVGGMDDFTHNMLPGLGMPALAYNNPGMGGGMGNPGMMGGPGMGGGFQ